MNRSTEKMLDQKGLPQAKLAEDMILGGLVSGQVFPVAVESVLSTDDFANEAHRRIFRACSAISAKGEDVNRVSVAQYLEIAGELASVGGLSYLIELESYPYPVDLEGFVNSIKNASLLRKTIHACDSVIQRCITSHDSEETLTWAEGMLTKIGEDAKGRVSLQNPDQVMLTAEGGINGFFYPQRNSGVSTPWERLNDITGGLLAGQLIVIGAYTGVGKSAAAAQIAQYAAQCGKGTVLFSFEMTRQEIFARMICQRSGINGHKHQTGYLSREEQAAFQKAAAEMRESPVWISDKAATNVLGVQAALRRHQTSHKLGLVIIDYLQLMESLNRHENRVQQITEITRGLKRMAGEQEVAVLALSQLNRASQDGSPPSLKHLRESGSIEQDADKVILLHQPRKDSEDFNGMHTAAIDTEFRVEKNRGGPTGKITLLFQRAFTRFDDISAPTGNHYDSD